MTDGGNINRTIEELKCSKRVQRTPGIGDINRTIEELKLFVAPHSSIAETYINRTIEELKYQGFGFGGGFGNISIAPLRN